VVIFIGVVVEDGGVRESVRGCAFWRRGAAAEGLDGRDPPRPAEQGSAAGVHPVIRRLADAEKAARLLASWVAVVL
jgi:hypothetical protein